MCQFTVKIWSYKMALYWFQENCLNKIEGNSVYSKLAENPVFFFSKKLNFCLEAVGKLNWQQNYYNLCLGFILEASDNQKSNKMS